MTKYYIVSKKWTGKGTHPNQVTFWRPDSKGYTVYIEAAGVYSKEELKGIPIGFFKDADNYALPCEIIDDMKTIVIPNEKKNIKMLEKWHDN